MDVLRPVDMGESNMELGVKSDMQEMVVRDVLEVIGKEYHVMLEVVDMEVPAVTVETQIADVEVGDVGVIIIVMWPAVARKLVINVEVPEVTAEIRIAIVQD